MEAVRRRPSGGYRDGRLVRVEFNLNREAALRSAGLDPQSS